MRSVFASGFSQSNSVTVRTLQRKESAAKVMETDFLNTGSRKFCGHEYPTPEFLAIPELFLEAVLKSQIYKHAAQATESGHCKLNPLARRAYLEKFSGPVFGPLPSTRVCENWRLGQSVSEQRQMCAGRLEHTPG